MPETTEFFAAFQSGWLEGFAAGFAAATLTEEQRAELAARRFYALETFEIDNRRRGDLDRGWYDVRRARAEQGASR